MKRNQEIEPETLLVDANLVRDFVINFSLRRDYTFLAVMRLGSRFNFFLFDILGTRILVRGVECEAGFFAIMNRTFSVSRTSFI